MYEFWLRFHWSLFLKGSINNIPDLVQIMAWRLSGDKPLSEPMMVSLRLHIYASLGLNELRHQHLQNWLNAYAWRECSLFNHYTTAFWIIFFKMQFYFPMLFTANDIFLYMKLVQCNEYLVSTVGNDYWWSGALTPHLNPHTIKMASLYWNDPQAYGQVVRGRNK